MVHISTPEFEATLRVNRYAPHTVMPRHVHEFFGASVILHGSLNEEAEHRSVTPTSGWVVVKPAGTHHANRFGPTVTTLLAVTVTPRATEETRYSWGWSDKAMTYRSALRLLRASSRPDEATRADALVEFIASLQDCEDGRPTAWLRRVKEALDELSVRPSLAQLAADAGVHPVYLARRFRRVFGVSPREYRQIVQVRRATDMILATRRPLSEIAHACGFADHSHMCRSFRVVASVNPSTLRDQ